MLKITDFNGYFLRDDFTFDPEIEIALDVIPAQGLYQPKWDGEQWIEGSTQEEIDALKNRPVELTPEQEETKMLKKRLDETENAMMTLMEIAMMGEI